MKLRHHPLGIFFWLSILTSVFTGRLPAQDVFTLQVGSPPPPPSILVSHGDLWRYRKGTNSPGTGWQTIADTSLDSTWLSGRGGFGYADNTPETVNCQTLLPDMKVAAATNYLTLYMRRTFQITSPVDSSQHLQLTMDWVDGFVAYLDGVEIQRAVTREAVGVEPAYNSTAVATHESSHGNSTPINPPVTYDFGRS